MLNVGVVVRYIGCFSMFMGFYICILIFVFLRFWIKSLVKCLFIMFVVMIKLRKFFLLDIFWFIGFWIK